LLDMWAMAQFVINTTTLFLFVCWWCLHTKRHWPFVWIWPQFSYSHYFVRCTKVTQQMMPVSVTCINCNWLHSHHKNVRIRHVVFTECGKLKHKFMKIRHLFQKVKAGTHRSLLSFFNKYIFSSVPSLLKGSTSRWLVWYDNEQNDNVSPPWSKMTMYHTARHLKSAV